MQRPLGGDRKTIKKSCWQIHFTGQLNGNYFIFAKLKKYVYTTEKWVHFSSVILKLFYLCKIKKICLHYRKVGALSLCDSLPRKEKLNGII